MSSVEEMESMQQPLVLSLHEFLAQHRIHEIEKILNEEFSISTVIELDNISVLYQKSLEDKLKPLQRSRLLKALKSLRPETDDVEVAAHETQTPAIQVATTVETRIDDIRKNFAEDINLKTEFVPHKKEEEEEPIACPLNYSKDTLEKAITSQQNHLILLNAYITGDLSGAYGKMSQSLLFKFRNSKDITLDYLRALKKVPECSHDEGKCFNVRKKREKKKHVKFLDSLKSMGKGTDLNNDVKVMKDQAAEEMRLKETELRKANNGWTCNMCKKINGFQMWSCESCCTTRPPPPRPQSKPRPRQKVNHGSVRNSPSNLWPCSNCHYVNQIQQAICCHCDTPKEKLEEIGENLSSSSIAARQEGNLKKDIEMSEIKRQFQILDSWSCFNCLHLISNIHDRCTNCSRRKDQNIESRVTSKKGGFQDNTSPVPKKEISSEKVKTPSAAHDQVTLNITLTVDELPVEALINDNSILKNVDLAILEGSNNSSQDISYKHMNRYNSGISKEDDKVVRHTSNWLGSSHTISTLVEKGLEQQKEMLSNCQTATQTNRKRNTESPIYPTPKATNLTLNLHTPMEKSNTNQNKNNIDPDKLLVPAVENRPYSIISASGKVNSNYGKNQSTSTPPSFKDTKILRTPNSSTSSQDSKNGDPRKTKLNTKTANNKNDNRPPFVAGGKIAIKL